MLPSNQKRYVKNFMVKTLYFDNDHLVSLASRSKLSMHSKSELVFLEVFCLESLNAAFILVDGSIVRSGKTSRGS